jgi:hypothetical protein
MGKLPIQYKANFNCYDDTGKICKAGTIVTNKNDGFYYGANDVLPDDLLNDEGLSFSFANNVKFKREIVEQVNLTNQPAGMFDKMYPKIDYRAEEETIEGSNADLLEVLEKFVWNQQMTITKMKKDIKELKTKAAINVSGCN